MSLVNEHKYDDIIDLPHHISARHPQMPLADRAAQFSPFAALTGHEAAIRETARLTEAFVELDEDRKRELDEQLLLIREESAKEPEIEVTYFRPDLKKSGGTYVTARGRVQKIDGYSRQIHFVDGTVIPMENLYSLEIMRRTDA
ncbi:MAG: YolD-like family protein [Eubacterium sp.]|nr:YolD-like family protein [Eubacterium sp.]MCM1304016.1 YolD-like family protein [Butyrivibrio sp.]MCM1343554.1 YolD-like family protein [Muribaculaceae bacterium]MCM1410583.1 YolD-like family protein [Lachnospiraceae bacterium]